MSNRILLLITALSACVFNSCTKDFVETDLKGKQVLLTSPGNNTITTVLTHTFWWKKITGADKYNLQIVNPSFSAPQALLLDTNVAEDHFSFTLLPGQYEWRVRAFNGSSQSNYSVFSLTIDSTASLAGQALILNSPADKFLTNSTAPITFRWDTLYNADDYRFQILDSANSIKVDVIVTDDNFAYTLGAGKYSWQVRAQNASSNTLYSVRTFTIDITAPPVSVSTYPMNGDSINKPDTLLWTRHSQAIGDSLFIYTDSLISAPSVNIYQTTTSYIFNGTVNSKYFWRLRSVDAAGNWSSYGTLRKFYVK